MVLKYLELKENVGTRLSRLPILLEVCVCVFHGRKMLKARLTFKRVNVFPKVMLTK